MRNLHSLVSSTGLCMALTVGSLATLASPAFAADAQIQINANGEVLSPTSTATLQRSLAAHHVYQGKIDGVWGQQTEAALRQFQAQNKLEASGRVDAPTAQKLGLQIERLELSDKGAPPTTETVVGPNGSDDANTSVQLSALSLDQAKEMQQRLQLLGYYKGPIDGELGAGTRAALRKFFEHQARLASKGSVSNASISLFGTQPNEIQRVSGTDKR